MQIRLPLSEEDYWFFKPGGVRAPHVRRAIAHTDTSITFDGYFYLEPAVFREDRPVKRLLYFQKHMYYIAIHKKTVGSDTSVYSPDEEYEGGICFFPTEITELHYTVLETDPPKERFDAYMKEMEEAEPAIVAESDAAKRVREEAEMNEYLKTADFSWLKQSQVWRRLTRRETVLFT